MQFNEPKNSEKYYWTKHVKMKMRQYGLSGQRVTRVIRVPERVEEGIAVETVAVMQPQSTRRGEDGAKQWKSEIWVMYQTNTPKKARTKKDALENLQAEVSSIEHAPRGKEKYSQPSSSKIKIISAWRYPGVTKPGEGLPEEIMAEIAEAAL